MSWRREGEELNFRLVKKATFDQCCTLKIFIAWEMPGENEGLMGVPGPLYQSTPPALLSLSFLAVVLTFPCVPTREHVPASLSSLSQTAGVSGALGLCAQHQTPPFDADTLRQGAFLFWSLLPRRRCFRATQGVAGRSAGEPQPLPKAAALAWVSEDHRSGHSYLKPHSERTCSLSL